MSSTRYSRQMALRNFGPSGQARLAAARVLVVGAGGLGCGALPFLAAAGIGKIGIADDDRIELANLHRQVLYTTDEVGELKSETAAKRLRAMNPEIEVVSHPIRLDVRNAESIIADYDAVIDATDRFDSRYTLDAVCGRLRKPLIFGAISDFEGQIAVLHYANSEGASASYRDFFPEPPRADEVRNCGEGGVLGVLPGIVGALQAAEALKLLSGCGKPIGPGLLTYSALTQETRFFGLPSPGPTARSSADPTRSETAAARVREISAAEFDRLRESEGESITVIDVREAGERPSVSEFAHFRHSLSRLDSELPSLPKTKTVLFCKSGARSLRAGQILAARFGEEKIFYSLRGGIVGWMAERERER